MDYTKGTWERHNAPNGEHLWAGKEHIADFDGPHANANAKLGCAAPEMYEALKAIESGVNAGKVDIGQTRYVIILDAIAKAEGADKDAPIAPEAIFRYKVRMHDAQLRYQSRKEK